MLNKVASIFLSSLVIVLTIIYVLSIWEVIDIDDIASKSLKTLIVLAVATGLILFFTHVLGKQEKSEEELHQ